MADTKLSGLTELAVAPATGDLVEIVDVSDTAMGAGGTNKKITAANLHSGLETTTGAQAKVDAHTTDTTDAHAASAITNTPAGNIAATTVQTALNELDTEKADASATTTALAGKAATSHTHAESDVTSLVTDLAAKQPLDSDLTTIAGLTATTDSFIQSKASAWASRTPTQVTADLIAVVGDSGSGGTKGLVPAPGSGDAAAGKYLKADGTFAVPGGGGGQTLVTKVVASSGGDYTTLGAALTAASTGWSIYVRPGTYSESAITCALDNITIIGNGAESTVISMAGNAITFSGTKLRIQGVTITMTNGTLTTSGTFAEIYDNHILKTGTGSTGGIIVNSGADNTYSRNYINSAVTSTASHLIYNNGGLRFGFFENRYTFMTGAGGASTVMPLQLSSESQIANNIFYSATNVTTTGSIVRLTAASQTSIIGNRFVGQDINANNTCISASSNSVALTIAGNHFRIFKVGINTNNMGSYTISSNSFAPSQTSAISVTAATPGAITGNNFAGSGASDTGIDINNGYGIAISGNRFENHATAAVNAGSGTSNFTITGNNFYSNTVNIALNSTAKGCTVYGNNGLHIGQNYQAMNMKNVSGGTIVLGDVVIWNAVTNGDEVTTTTTAGDDKVFGVAAEGITTASYGMVQTLGAITVSVDGTGTAIAVGDLLTCHTTAKKAVKAAAGNTVFARALATASTSTTIQALLIAPFKI